jgi:archaellum component FlaC
MDNNEEFQDTIQSLIIEIENIKDCLEEIYSYNGDVKKLFMNYENETYVERKVNELSDKVEVFNWWWKVIKRDVKEMKENAVFESK